MDVPVCQTSSSLLHEGKIAPVHSDSQCETSSLTLSQVSVPFGNRMDRHDDPLGFFEPPEALVPAGLGATRQAPSP